MADNKTVESIEELQRLLFQNSSSQSLGVLNSVMAETLGMAMHNAVDAQRNSQLTNAAATTSACARILQVKAKEPNRVSSPIFQAGGTPPPTEKAPEPPNPNQASVQQQASSPLPLEHQSSEATSANASSSPLTITSTEPESATPQSKESNRVKVPEQNNTLQAAPIGGKEDSNNENSTAILAEHEEPEQPSFYTGE